MDISSLLLYTSVLANILLVYFTFFKTESRYKKLIEAISDIEIKQKESTEYLDKLQDDRIKMSNETAGISMNLKRLKEELDGLKRAVIEETNKLQATKKEYDQLLYSIDVRTKEANRIDIQRKESEIFLKTSAPKILELKEELQLLESRVLELRHRHKELDNATTFLQDRKADLENENSHLSLEIAKKKITYGSKIAKYEDESGDERKIKYIGYLPNDYFSNSHFPFVAMPKANSVIKFPRKGLLGQRGFKEAEFEEYLKTYFYRQRNIQFYNDRMLVISDKTKTFEPDFTLIDEREDKNIYIDIEIDEPYDLVNRVAMHYTGVDDFRNDFFVKRGWIVIRFSEYQVHTNPMGCCRLISDVISSIDYNFETPVDLLSYTAVTSERFWTKVQAEKWAKDRYRESYLGLTTIVEHQKVHIDTSNIIQNESERESERKVEKELGEIEKPIGDYNIINAHSRDKRLKFYPEPHLYLIDDNPKTISASTLVKQFFPDFDSEYWAKRKAEQRGIPTDRQLQEWEANRIAAASQGTELHADIEKYFATRGQYRAIHKKEFNHFIRFYEEHLKGLRLYRTEWRIFDDWVYVAGTADMIFKKPDGSLAVYDWKRSKEIKQGNPFTNGIGVCSDLQDCNYVHYSLQLNIYKKILEDHYGKKVSEMKMIQLHPDYDNYRVFDVNDLREKVDDMFEAYHR